MSKENVVTPKEGLEDIWLSSTETKKVLKVSSCELMHLRVSGKLPYKKQGNAYLYQIHTKSKQGA